MQEADLIVCSFLDRLDLGREKTFQSLVGLEESRIWIRPETNGWCIGEILDHTRVLNRSFLTLIRTSWFFNQPLARMRQNKPYAVEIDDVYHRPGFPMNTGWLWSPRHTPQKNISLARLCTEIQEVHLHYREFYTSKNPDLLGHITLYDPVIGRINLIQALRVILYHDQLHYKDVVKLAAKYKLYTTPVA